MGEIHVDRLTRRFGDFTAVDDVDMRFANGTVTCLLGPSGCGKTTLMRIIAGLERPTAGRVFIGGQDVTALPTRARDIGMVFQYPVMYRTLSVRANIAEPLRRRGLAAAERARRVERMLDLLGMRDHGDAHIDELDAGMRQKVAVGRAVARQTQVVLFDEPTTNVELHAKLQLIRAFKEITRELRQTIIYVTHDQTEAMTLADSIALMDGGRIVQHAPPRELYGRPTTTFGGWFLGDPGMNFMPARVEGGQAQVPLLANPLPVPASASGEFQAGIRPEDIEVRPAPGPGTVAGQVLERTVGIAGRHLLRVDLAGQPVAVKVDAAASVAPGATVHLAVDPAAVELFADGKLVG